MRTLILPLWIFGGAALAAASIAWWLQQLTPVLLPLPADAISLSSSSSDSNPDSLSLSSSVPAGKVLEALQPVVSPVPKSEASAFIALKQSAVTQDRLGNYCVEVSTAGFPSREYLLSDRPIYYPQHSMFDNTGSLQGCPLSVYYLEHQARGTLVVLRKNTASIFHYQCVFDAATSDYQLKKIKGNHELAGSLNQLLMAGEKPCSEKVM